MQPVTSDEEAHHEPSRPPSGMRHPLLLTRARDAAARERARRQILRHYNRYGEQAGVEKTSMGGKEGVEKASNGTGVGKASTNGNAFVEKAGAGGDACVEKRARVATRA